MANELNLYADANGTTYQGLTDIVARLYNTSGQVGSDIPMVEVTDAIYTADVPLSTPAGTFGVRFYQGSTLLAQGCLSWDGEKEVDTLLEVPDLPRISA